MITSILPSSFRDPSGFVFKEGGEIFRQVNVVYKDHYDFLMSSGLYERLVDGYLLVPHEEVANKQEGQPQSYKTLRPEPIPFISYPYEWSFSQLKHAALATLEIQKIALDFGMTLKDASAYNMQFLEGHPVFIDILSFEKYYEGEPWIAYRQFCQHFLAPLALMAYKHTGLSQLSRIYIDGIPLDMASSLLPARTKLKPALQMHIHLHSKFQSRYSDNGDSAQSSRKAFKLTAFRGMIDSLESAIKKLKWNPSGTEWGDYESQDSYILEGVRHKLELVDSFITEVQPRSVWDIGGNTGEFSRLASDKGIHTISFDKDPLAVERNYLASVKMRETQILPLVMDFTNPSPTLGWANRERMDLSERGPADMLLALALIHHLAISENVPLGMIAEYFHQLGKWVVVEFVPKSDKQVARLLATRKDIFPNYTERGFESEFSEFFEIVSVQRIKDSERTLYLLRGK